MTAHAVAVQTLIWTEQLLHVTQVQTLFHVYSSGTEKMQLLSVLHYLIIKRERKKTFNQLCH